MYSRHVTIAPLLQHCRTVTALPGCGLGRTTNSVMIDLFQCSEKPHHQWTVSQKSGAPARLLTAWSSVWRPDRAAAAASTAVCTAPAVAGRNSMRHMPLVQGGNDGVRPG